MAVPLRHSLKPCRDNTETDLRNTQVKGKSNRESTSLLLQGSILTIAQLIAKVIGLIYRIPLTGILGDSGNSYYSTANEIYTMVLLISSFSLPIAISKLMSERIARKEYKNAYRVFVSAMRMAILFGALASIVTYALAGFITDFFFDYPLARHGLRVLAPAILIFAITGVFRGYFQGFGDTVPTALSQVAEQIVNAVLSVLCASVMFRYGLSLMPASPTQADEVIPGAWGAAGATFGTVGSVTVALLIMIVIFVRRKNEFARKLASDKDLHAESETEVIYPLLFATVLPIIGSQFFSNITNITDVTIFNKILIGQGYAENQYSIIWGIYVGKYRVLLNVVLALASSLGAVIVPSLSASFSRKDHREIAEKVGLSVRFSMLFTIPCALGLAALGSPVIEMLFHPVNGLPLVGGIFRAGAALIIFSATATLTASSLQGIGEMKIPLINTLISLLVEIICGSILLKVFRLNIYGIVFANIVFTLLMTVLNYRALGKKIRYRQELQKTFLIPLAASTIMAIAVYGIYHVVSLIFGVTLSCIVSIAAGAAIYAVALVTLRGISPEEILMLPKGRTILSLLRSIGLLK